MPNYKMELAYDGTKYNGWQKQGNTRNTLQGLLEFVLEKLLEKPIEIHGAGRTDAGVHAKGQVANFHCDTVLDTADFLKRFNKSLPKDVAVLGLEKMDDRFHSRLNAKKKIYEYRIWNSHVSNVFEGRYLFQSSEKLDVQQMKKASEVLLGSHDFKSFCANKRYKKSTVRTIESIELIQKGNELKMVFCGDGFLYNMVRIMAGTLLQVGEGKIDWQDVETILNAKNREKAGITLPPQGLTLVKVYY